MLLITNVAGEANVRVCFDLINFRIQLLFPFDSFDGYCPDCLTFSCSVVKRLELTAVLWTGLPTSFNLCLGLLKDFISLIGFPFYLFS